MPNEYDTQVNSGVYDTLSSLPYFDNYFPDPETSKSNVFYELWGRPTLEYKPTCDLTISSAISVLDGMSMNDE